MPVRKAHAAWEGTLKEGNGTVKLGSGAFEGPYNFSGRFEDGTGTNPEELLGAAHAGCFTMKINAVLHAKGYAPERVASTANVTIEKVNDAMTITKIVIDTTVEIDGLDQAELTAIAQEAHDGCIVSIALGAIPEIVINATLA
jgi:osmotically inducible protein OsmC